jgi:accessory colonization factor AcfC
MSLDAWIIWNVWQVANPTQADVVPIETGYAIYRDTGIVMTKKGANIAAPRQFIASLKSPMARPSFSDGAGLPVRATPGKRSRQRASVLLPKP